MKRNTLPKKILLAHLAMLLATIIWSAAGPVIKLTLDFIPPFTFLALRFTIVGAILLPYLFFYLKNNPIDWADIPNIFWLGLFGQASIILVFLGLEYTTAIDAAIIGLLTPVATIAAGHFFFKEKVNLIQKIGYGIATVGLLITAIEPVLQSTTSEIPMHLRVWGNFLVVLYQLTWPAYIILGKRMMGKRSLEVSKTFKYFHLHQMHQKYDPTVLTALTFYVGLIVIVPFAIWESFGTPLNHPLSLNTTALFGLLYMAVFSSILGYVFFEWGLKRLQAAETALYNYIAPLFAIPIAMVLLGESLTPTVMLGMAIITVGVAIAETYKS